MHLSEVWEADSPAARLLRGALWPAAQLYAVGWEAYASVYRLGLKRFKAPHCPIVCVGNLVSGGTGKSPVTVRIAEVLQELGFSVVVSASGYGSPAAEAARIAPEGELNAAEWGDEPAMIRTLLPHAPLIVGRRRVLAATLCAQFFPDSVLLMDDGFQHLPLLKHVSVVLDPERRNHQCLPAGPYREPRRNRRFADAVIPGDFSVASEPLSLERASPKDSGAPGGKPNKVAVLTALAQPQRFLCDLQAIELKIVSQKLLPDHDPMQTGNLFDALPPGVPILCTLKDWVKLRERADVDKHEIWVAKQRIRIEPEEEFRRWLADRLHELT